MGFPGKIFTVFAALVLFVITQYICDATVGALDWFFINLPSSMDVWDFPVLYILSHPLADFIIQWLPVTCLGFSMLLFMHHKTQWAYLLIVAPLVPAIMACILFYYAAQIHVRPGDGLFRSGVMIGKVESYALTKEKEARKTENAD